MRRLVALLAVLVLLCTAVCVSLAEVPDIDLSVMSAADLKQLQGNIASEIMLHHEMNSTTESAVKKAAESVAEEYYRQKGIKISWAWHGWEYDYKREKDFFTFSTHLDYKDSNDKNHQVKVAADLFFDGTNYTVYHLYLDKELVFSLEGRIPEDKLIDTSNVIINEKTGINLSLLPAEDLKKLQDQVKKELDTNHNARNSGRVNDVLKKTVESLYAKKGVSKVEWPWFDYEYTCDWNCYTEKTRITFEENGKKNRDIPVYAELFPEGNSYVVYYLKIGDEIVTDHLDQINSTEGKLFLNSRKYEQAKHLLAEGQYEQAMVLFAELGDFDDSVLMLGESRQRNSQAVYDEALLLMEGGNWEEAAIIFDGLGDFSDSSEKAAQCRNAILDRDYQKALGFMNAGSFDQAEAAFIALEGYLDSAQKAEDCRDAVRKNQYDLAQEKMTAGDYTGTMAMFSAMDGYLDSAQKVEDCREAVRKNQYGLAQEKMTAGDFAGALALFTALDGYLDSGEQAAACQLNINQQTYAEAEELLAAGEYVKANEVFELLGDFDDSAQRSETVRGIISSLDREIAFAEDELHLFPGETAVLAPEIKKTEDTAPDDTVLTFSSGDPAVAKVDATGLVKAVAAGETVIHCEAADNTYIGADITVHVEKNVSKVTMSDTVLNLSVPNQNGNGEAQLQVSIDPADAYVQTGVWSSSNEAVATVDQEGHVTAVGAGKAIISFLSDDASKAKKEAKCNVTVAQAVTAVKLNETSGTVYVGKLFTLKATVEPATAKNKKVEWSSSNESVATVTATGQVKGVSPGTVVITAKSVDGPSETFAADVKIAPVTLKVSGTARCVAKNHVGNSWGKQLNLNGDPVNGTGRVTVENGDYITVEWEIWENDKNPDWGHYFERIEITPEIMTKGCKIEATVWVTENGGRYSGNSAEWAVTITIKP